MVDPHRRVASFGAPAVEAESVDDVVQPVPVLHVGEVHADLRLHLTEETLTELRSQLESLVAQATRDGFAAGMAAALGENSE